MAKQIDPGLVFHCFGYCVGFLSPCFVYGFGSVALAWFSWVCLWIWLLFHGFVYGVGLFFFLVCDVVLVLSLFGLWFWHGFHGFAYAVSLVCLLVLSMVLALSSIFPLLF